MALRRVAVVVSQHATKSFAAFDLARDLPYFMCSIDGLAFEPLMISFFVTMVDEFLDCVSHD